MTEKVGVTILYEENIEKIFKMDIIEKKRIGSNIFRRVSTRKGGSNMTTMRVPTQKEQKLLSGEVKVYNMKEIIPFEEFVEKDQNEQKRLLEFWRNNYKTADILKGMNIDKNVFYRMLNQLDIPKKDMGQGTKKTLSDEEFDKYYNDDVGFISFPLFKKLVFEQQQKLFEKYLSRFGNIQLLNKEWKGSKLNTLYYISSKNKKEEDQTPTTEEHKPKVTEVSKPKNSISQEMQEWKRKQPDVFISYRTKELSFNYEGDYNKETVIKRIKMMLEEIEASEVDLRVTLTISEKEGTE